MEYRDIYICGVWHMVIYIYSVCVDVLYIHMYVKVYIYVYRHIYNILYICVSSLVLKKIHGII